MRIDNGVETMIDQHTTCIYLLKTKAYVAHAFAVTESALLVIDTIDW